MSAEVRAGYKRTEVGVIPEEWEVRSLKQISPTQSVGLVINPSAYHDKLGSIPLLVGSNIRENCIDAENANRITEASNSRIPASQLRSADLVTVRVGAPGVTAVVPPELDGCNCASVMIVRRHDSFDSNWLCAVMNSRVGRSQVENVQYGTAQKQFNISDAVDFVYPVPPIKEQRAIASALGWVDQLRASLDRLIGKKRDIKHAAMEQLLTGQARLPGFSDEWERPRLGKLARIQRGASPRPIDSPVWFDDTSPTGWVRISDVSQSGMYLRSTTQRLSPMGVLHSRPVASGSLIMSICATVGRPVITEIDVCIHDGFVVFDDLKVDKHFLYFALKRIEPDWSKQGQTGSQMNLNTGLINDTAIHVPRNSGEQRAIATTLSDMDEELAALSARREKLAVIKLAMMQELLSGRIRLL